MGVFSGGYIRFRGGYGVLEGCGVGFVGVFGFFLLWWSFSRVLFLWTFVGSWVLGVGS